MTDMAKIRVPGAEQPVRSPSGNKSVSPFELGLVKAGIAKNPKEARELVRGLLEALQGAGFSTAPKAPLDKRLAAEVSAFQKSQGLPTTGKLDHATIQRLREEGLWPNPSPASPGAAANEAIKPAIGLGRPGEASPKLENAARDWLNFASQPGLGGGPTGGAGPPGGDAASAAAKAPVWQQIRAQTQASGAARSIDDKNTEIPDLLRFLSSLGFTGAGSGKNALKSALRRFQHALGLPPSGRLDAATLRELNAREMPRAAPPAPGEAKSSLPPEKSQEPPSPTQRNADGASEPKSGAGSGGAGGAGAGLESADGRYLSLGQMDGQGRVEDDANAPAGDQDRENRRRGHAMLDELEDGEEGHYEMPALSIQIFKALEEISRIEDERGAATYSWDVTFYRPGIYGRRQPAEALWHIGVEKASPFDSVWQQAQEALAAKLSQSEPQAAVFTWEQMQAALRRARVRGPASDPSFSAAAAARFARRKI